MRTAPLLTTATGLVAAAAAQNSSASCVSGDAVHIVVARASLEPVGTGAIGNVSARVAAQLPGSDVVAVDYPATLDNYTTSEAAGVAAMASLVTSYAGRCPGSKMVLMGYSQGAQVTMDVLCGTTEKGFNTTQALSTSIQENIAAVVLFGDPSKAANQTFLQGTSTKDGFFPRPDTSACAAVTSRIASYCNANDTFCDSGNSLEVHLSYVQDNGTSAVDFVLQQIKSAGGSSPSSGSNTTGSTTGGSSSGKPSPAATTTTTNAAASFPLQNAFTTGLGLVSLGLGFLFIL